MKPPIRTFPRKGGREQKLSAHVLSNPVRVFIGMGSNVGDRLGHLREAAAGLDLVPGTRVRALSPVYETSAVGPRQRDFLNAAAEIATTLPPAALLAALKALETRLGRRRRQRWGPREIDLDILFYGSLRRRAKALAVPHPRLRERRFALKPLADLAPFFRDPVTGLSARRLLNKLTDSGQRVRLYRRRFAQ